MSASQNGWHANDRSVVASQLVPGTEVHLTVRKDAPGQLLLEVASAVDRLVEDIDNSRGGLDDWGYAERPIRGGSQLSNHSSGTAVDLNAPRHPLGKRGTFSRDQVAGIHRILAVAGGVVRWGGDYGDPAHGGVRGSRVDEMHFEINDGQSMADCERALTAMRQFNGEVKDMVPVLKEGDGQRGGGERGALHWYVVSLQVLLNVRGLSAQVPVTGEFGPDTTAMVKELQARSGLPADGRVTADTWRWVLGNSAPDFA